MPCGEVTSIEVFVSSNGCYWARLERIGAWACGERDDEARKLGRLGDFPLVDDVVRGLLTA